MTSAAIFSQLDRSKKKKKIASFLHFTSLQLNDTLYVWTTLKYRQKSWKKNIVFFILVRRNNYTRPHGLPRSLILVVVIVSFFHSNYLSYVTLPKNINVAHSYNNCINDHNCYIRLFFWSHQRSLMSPSQRSELNDILSRIIQFDCRWQILQNCAFKFALSLELLNVTETIQKDDAFSGVQLESKADRWSENIIMIKIKISE